MGRSHTHSSRHAHTCGNECLQPFCYFTLPQTKKNNQIPWGFCRWTFHGPWQIEFWKQCVRSEKCQAASTYDEFYSAASSVEMTFQGPIVPFQVNMFFLQRHFWVAHSKTMLSTTKMIQRLMLFVLPTGQDSNPHRLRLDRLRVNV